MIKGTFKIGSELHEVVVRGNELLFFDVSSNLMTTIEGLRLSKGASIKEFPDLENDDDWKKKVIERFKLKLKDFVSELDKIYYVRDELVKQGYHTLFYQRAGFRPEKFKEVLVK